MGSAPSERQYNQDGYKIYCKKYQEYIDWIKNRNEKRYQTNLDHSKNYDSKNMSHCFRLLESAKDIFLNKAITLKPENIDFLLAVKNGKYDYDYLIELSDKKFKEIEELYKISTLPDSIDKGVAEKILVNIRKDFYKQKKPTN